MEESGVPTLLRSARASSPIHAESISKNSARASSRCSGVSTRSASAAELSPSQISTFDRVLRLPARLTIDRLEAGAVHAVGEGRYATISRPVPRAGLDAQRCMLIDDFPVTYLAIGYSRGGFGPRETDLVAYRGRAGRGQAIGLSSTPIQLMTEALVFG